MILGRARASLFTIAVLVGVVAAMALPGRAAAYSLVNSHVQLDGKVVVSPSALEVDAMPGHTVTRPLLVQNRTSAPVTFQLEISEVVGGDAQNIVDVLHGVHSGAAAWATIERPQVVVPPGYTATIKVTIVVPKSAPPGSQAFSVTATQQPQQPKTPTGGAGVAPIFEQEAIFIVNLPGNAPIHGKVLSTQITAATPAGQAPPSPRDKQHWFISRHGFALSLTYQNTGSRLLTPQGTATVTNLFGHVVHTYQIPRFTVYPDGGENAPTINLKGLPGFGPLTLHIHLSSDAGDQSVTVGKIWRFPGWFVFLVFGLLTLLVLWLAVIGWDRWLSEVGPLTEPRVNLAVRAAAALAVVVLLVLSLVGVGPFGDRVLQPILVGLAVGSALLALVAVRERRMLADFGDDEWDDAAI